MRKKLLIIAIAAAILLLFPSCGGSAGPETKTEPPSSAELPSSSETASAVSSADDAGVRTDALVVVFSATGNTKAVAEKLAVLTGADLREIVPAQPYTAEDLDYGDGTARATAEQNDPDARPAIAEDISLDGYKTVYLGYPIWWGQAPRIMSTFVESHDFTGITVIPFCTSGSSDIGASDDTLAEQAGTGNWLQGKRFPGNAAEDALRAWIAETNG